MGTNATPFTLDCFSEFFRYVFPGEKTKGKDQEFMNLRQTNMTVLEYMGSCFPKYLGMLFIWLQIVKLK